MALGNAGPFNFIRLNTGIHFTGSAGIVGEQGWDSTDGLVIYTSSGWAQFFTTTDNNIRIGKGVLGTQFTNDAAGTANKLFAVITTSGTYKTAPTSAMSDVVGVVVDGGGTSGLCSIAVLLLATVTMDGAATAGHYVQLSTTSAGKGHDTGSTAVPTTGGPIVGIVMSTIGSAGDTSVLLLPPFLPPSSGGGGGGLTAADPYLTDGSGNYYIGGGIPALPPGGNPPNLSALNVVTATRNTAVNNNDLISVGVAGSSPDDYIQSWVTSAIPTTYLATPYLISMVVSPLYFQSGAAGGVGIVLVQSNSTSVVALMFGINPSGFFINSYPNVQSGASATPVSLSGSPGLPVPTFYGQGLLTLGLYNIGDGSGTVYVVYSTNAVDYWLLGFFTMTDVFATGPSTAGEAILGRGTTVAASVLSFNPNDTNFPV